jgi:AbrB family looped-hinge helix DNA binding protein
MTSMTDRLTLDKAGRVVIPKPLRDQLQLAPGDVLDLDSSGEQIILRLVRGTMPLQKERGIWVYRTGNPLPESIIDSAVRETREERHRQILGRLR